MGSDHHPIEIHTSDLLPETTRRPRWRLDEGNWENYERDIQDLVEPNTTYDPEVLGELILDAAKANIPRTSSKPGKKALHWWNDVTKAAVKARRKSLRRRKRTPKDHPDWNQINQEYQQRRNECRNIIRKAKNDSWEEFLEGFDSSQSTTEM